MLFRKEILITRELDQVNHIKDILAENGVKYCVTTNNITNPGRHHGVPFINSSAAFQYRVFVKRKDYEYAKKIIRKLRGY